MVEEIIKNHKTMFKKLFNMQKSKTNYPAIIQEIHKEFNGAADILLLEAKEFIANLDTSGFKKAERLLSLGFKKAEQAATVEQTKIEKSNHEETAKLIEYYSRNYPFNKFITPEKVQEICFKYGLVLGGVDLYKGFVPEEKITEIERFKLKKSDEIYLTVFDRNDNIIGHISKDDVDYRWINYFNSPGSLDYFFITVEGGGLSGHTMPVPHYEKYRHLSYVKASRKDAQLQICAPLKDMDMTGKTIEHGHKIINVVEKDPIVLHPVNGGYLIVTAWGDEASDPNVVNSINN